MHFLSEPISTISNKILPPFENIREFGKMDPVLKYKGVCINKNNYHKILPPLYNSNIVKW